MVRKPPAHSISRFYFSLVRPRFYREKLLSLLILPATLLAAHPAFGADVLVAVASNFTAPAQALAAKFAIKTGNKLVLSYGATERLFMQIKSDAPFEVFLSADQEHPQMLVTDGLADSGSRFTYAVGKLALWSRRPKLVDLNGDVLNSERFKHISIANPKLAPYGQAARQVLQKRGLWEKIQPRLVLGESISQAFQFVQSGNADLGFIAYSQIKTTIGAPDGSFWLVPQDLYSPIKQDAVLLKRGATNPVAAAFLEFLKGTTAREVISEFGYDLSNIAR